MPTVVSIVNSTPSLQQMTLATMMGLLVRNTEFTKAACYISYAGCRAELRSKHELSQQCLLTYALYWMAGKLGIRLMPITLDQRLYSAASVRFFTENRRWPSIDEAAASLAMASEALNPVRVVLALERRADYLIVDPVGLHQVLAGELDAVWPVCGPLETVVVDGLLPQLFTLPGGRVLRYQGLPMLDPPIVHTTMAGIYDCVEAFTVTMMKRVHDLIPVAAWELARMSPTCDRILGRFQRGLISGQQARVQLGSEQKRIERELYENLPKGYEAAVEWLTFYDFIKDGFGITGKETHPVKPRTADPLKHLTLKREPVIDLTGDALTDRILGKTSKE